MRTILARNRSLFLIGLAIYISSFFLYAATGKGPARGYMCAYLALTLPFEETPALPSGHFEGRILEYTALLISGWINPVFLLAALVMQFQTGSAFKVLRGIVLLMIPFCWVVFYYEHFYPREGHFLWVMGMLLVLFSGGLANIHRA